jgi:hypothetical protein
VQILQGTIMHKLTIAGRVTAVLDTTTAHAERPSRAPLMQRLRHATLMILIVGLPLGRQL